jgi:hypothetical protein
VVNRVDEDGEQIQVTNGYEREENLTTTVGEKSLTRIERLLVMRLLAQAHAAEVALRACLGKGNLRLNYRVRNISPSGWRGIFRFARR